MLETRPVDTMAEAMRNVKLGWDISFCQRFSRHEERVEGNDLIVSAMHQQYGRKSFGIVLKMLRPHQHTRIPENRSRADSPSKSDVQSHHRSLAEPHQSKVIRRNRVPLQLCIEKGFQLGTGLRNPTPTLVRVSERKTKPLPAHGSPCAGLRRMGTDEGCVRKDTLPFATNGQQVIPIGAIPVQENDKLSGFSGGSRNSRSIEHNQSFK